MEEKIQHYVAIILEDVNHKLDVLLEGQAALAPLIAKVAHTDGRLDRVEIDLKAGTAAIKDHSALLNNHEGRITRLEA